MKWALGLLVAGCASAHVPRVPGEPPPAVADRGMEDAYQALLERSTQSASLYDNFDTKAFVRAVWQSPAFVEARVRRAGWFRSLAADEVAAQVAAERARCAESTEFFFAVHTNDPKHEDFSRPNSIWTVTLVTDGQRVAPASVERLGRPTAEMRSIYSWMESFWIGYRVRFPKPAGRQVELLLASAIGQARLEFGAE